MRTFKLWQAILILFLAALIGSMIFKVCEPKDKLAFSDIVPNPAAQEELANGFWWSEGPVWVNANSENESGYLLFTDVPQNTLFKWSEAEGKSVYLKPSGKDVGEAEGFREPGANGLWPHTPGKLLMGDHGNRALMTFDIASKTKTVMSDSYNGKKLNSPNDVVQRDDGVIFFTDPPYGLTDIDDSPLKEQSFNGVYRRAVDGTLTVIDDTLTRPNGVSLSPDGKTLYVANSDPKAALWMAYELGKDDKVTKRYVFANVTENVGEAMPGLPDGMAVSKSGHLFATGPGGIYVFDDNLDRVGKIDIARASANCAFGDADGQSLYVTSGDRLIRIATTVTGVGF